ncbi:MAG: aminotransferase, partial [Acidobacteria bacterium]|nr:aminotransferase [Acidobacteriota bacterium]
HSAPSEVLAIIALEARERIVSRNLKIVLDNLAALRSFFASHPGLCQWIEPHGGSIAFPLWTGPGPVDEFCESVLRERGVLIAPGTLFDFPNHFRVGYGRRNLPDALAQLAG